MKRDHILLIVFAIEVFIPTTRLSAQVNVSYNTIALAGATGTALGFGPNLGPGVNFSSNSSTFTNPVINAAGQVAFSATVTGTGVTGINSVGIWTNAGGTLAVVARAGSQGPGPNLGAGVNFTSNLQYYGYPVLNAAGALAFRATLTGTSVDSSNLVGIWANAGGTLNAAARIGSADLGPNVGEGVTFSSIDPPIGNPVLNAAGKVAFSGFLTGMGVSSSNDWGIWTNVGGALAAVAREGSDGPGPNLGAGVNFSSFSTLALNGDPVLNSAGTVAFFGLLTGAGVTGDNDRGIWTNAGGTLAAVARTGSAGPGPNLGAGVNFSNVGSPVLNATGEVAFAAEVSGTGVSSSNDSGLWTNAGGTLSVVARKGSAGPGPNVGAGVNFNLFSNPVLNAAGQVAFSATLSGTGVSNSNDSGLWTHVGGTLTAVAREGSAAPTLAAGVNFGSFSVLNYPALNAAGQLAFTAALTGTGVSGSNDGSLWVWSQGQLTMIVREGDLFDVDPNPSTTNTRTILSIGLFSNSGGGEDGRGMWLNDDGRLTFRLVFTDNSSGIFTAQLPSPLHPGDFDSDGDVDGADFIAWQTNSPKASNATAAQGDADGDGDVDGADFVVWQTHFPYTPSSAAVPVPEPTSIALAFGVGGGGLLMRARVRGRKRK